MRQVNVIMRSNIRYITPLILLLHVFALAACGLKGDPTHKSYEMPQAPDNLSAIHRESRIILTWRYPGDGDDALKGFRIYRAEGDGFSEIGSTSRQIRMYEDEIILTDGRLSYKVRSENLRGVAGPDSDVIHVDVKPSPPPPSNVLFSVGRDSMKIEWEEIADAVLYNVYRSFTSGSYSISPVNGTPLSGHSFTDVLHPRKTVFYTVRSLLGNGIRHEGGPSEEIAVDPAVLIPGSPQGAQAVAAQGRIYVVWNEAPETWVRSYRVYRKFEGETEYVTIGETSTPAFADICEVQKGRSYRVTAVGPVSEGPPAETKVISAAPAP
jgi:hypothetical protein